jgi:hypothetical protein
VDPLRAEEIGERSRQAGRGGGGRAPGPLQLLQPCHDLRRHDRETHSRRFGHDHDQAIGLEAERLGERSPQAGRQPHRGGDENDAGGDLSGDQDGLRPNAAETRGLPPAVAQRQRCRSQQPGGDRCRGKEHGGSDRDRRAGDKQRTRQRCRRDW